MKIGKVIMICLHTMIYLFPCHIYTTSLLMIIMLNRQAKEIASKKMVLTRPLPIMLFKLLIMLLSNGPNFSYYAPMMLQCAHLCSIKLHNINFCYLSLKVNLFIQSHLFQSSSEH